MNVMPKLGIQGIPFGMDRADLIELLGQPATEQTIGDVETYPKSRLVLNYVHRSFLTTPESGVISIAIDVRETPIWVWGTKVNSKSPNEFAELLASKQCDIKIGEPDGWGDLDVESLEYGIIASFFDERLESIEIHDPTWWHNRQ